ncbi:MAG: glycosyl hydrolase 115 family protein [Lachnospiraceae bacterium]|nr:glycosyl hydrolase 115 family protein [Lachnospiraceae bacterium]
MEFILGGKDITLRVEDTAWPGVVRVAGKVAADITLVTDAAAEVLQSADAPKAGDVFAATVGRSALLEEWERAGILDLSALRGKREVYLFAPVVLPGQTAPTLVIAGSDKRGTIYGCFHLSELLGVSPWVWFADVTPAKKDTVTLTEGDCLVSKEPSVKYRGFFINDEWPSFGNWTFSHFGGFTAEMYDHVFELLLRLKGNYLWPAMWTSNFSLDGPGLENARLADEYGVVMSNSHHEPCLRHSEEWDLVRGETSEYGNAWNFDKNREGLTRYWRDGLRRNGKFENIVTMGMRGERDSEILGHAASLQENIDYLKEVITVQNRLIAQEMDADLSKVPRMLAVYKEVEDYFYGDAQTEGLRNWPELDGITCMLCEDNFGNMRRLPEDSERDRKGGWGMYYHFDYHGGPVSYEWICSTHLPKVWEQMSQAYESGVREIWIVNVGDLKPQELPLSYFLDLAYDFGRWGTSNTESAAQYLKEWTDRQFGADHDPELDALLAGYTFLNSVRKPETLGPDVYHPAHYGESREMLSLCDQYEEMAERQRKAYRGTPLYEAFEELVGFPVSASANLLRMQLSTGKNHMLSAQGRPAANLYAEVIDRCMKRDEELMNLYHGLAGGKWDGLMLSEHIGFTHWNDEEAQYPVRHLVYPSRRSRLVVAKTEGDEWTCGGDWTRRKIHLTGFLDPHRRTQTIQLENAGKGSAAWTAECDADWVKIYTVSGTLPSCEEAAASGEKDAFCGELRIGIDRRKLGGEPGETKAADLWIKTGFSKAQVVIYARVFTEAELAEPHTVPVAPAGVPADAAGELGVAVEVSEYTDRLNTGKGEFRLIKPYGRYGAGMKAFPVTAHFTPGIDAPSLTYDLYFPEDGEYEVTLAAAPSNPVDGTRHLRLGVQFGGESVRTVSFIREDFRAGENSCPEWGEAVLSQLHTASFTVSGRKGYGELMIYACDPGVVLERILVRKAGTAWAKGYLGLLPDWTLDAVSFPGETEGEESV